ncbi:hypothetical protein [Actinophytocola sp.]|uniref:hypothetical protein n=1 Tax=Actinophytocola sp. TaxID=1872138 RepID=UPI003D6BBFA4
MYAAVGSDDNLIAGNNTMVSFWRFRNDEGEAEDRGTDTASTTTSTTARAGDGDVLDGDA